MTEIMNGAPLETMEQKLERLRNVYAPAIDDILGRCMDELLLVDDQVALCLDAMQFCTFILCIKAVDAKRLLRTRENLMAVYWPMQKALKDDVPGMLRQFAEQAATAGGSDGVR